MKPLTVMIYDTFPEDIHSGNPKFPGVGKSVDYEMEFVKTDKPRKGEDPLHGLNVTKTFLHSIDNIGPMKVKIVAVPFPTIRSSKHWSLPEDFEKFPLEKQIKSFKASEYLDSQVQLHKPDVVITSIAFPSNVPVTPKGIDAPETAKFNPVSRGYQAVSKLRGVPIIAGAANTDDHMNETHHSGWMLKDKEANFFFVGHPSNAPGLMKNRAGVIHGLLNKSDIGVDITGTNVPLKFRMKFNKLSGNSFVTPMFVGMAVSQITQANSHYAKQTGFSLANKVLLMDTMQRLKESKAINSKRDVVNFLSGLQDQVRMRYAEEVKKRNKDIKLNRMSDQTFLQNTFNTAPLAE